MYKILSQLDGATIENIPQAQLSLSLTKAKMLITKIFLNPRGPGTSVQYPNYEERAGLLHPTIYVPKPEAN